jgi:hypothetical protein
MEFWQKWNIQQLDNIIYIKVCTQQVEFGKILSDMRWNRIRKEQ